MASVEVRLDRESWSPDVLVSAHDEDGEVITAHVSSNDGWARQDIQRSVHLDAIQYRYPEGYELDWKF